MSSERAEYDRGSTRAESEADTPAPDVTTAKKQIAAKLNDHTTRDNAISSQALADYTGLKPTTVRDAIKEIRREYGVPVVSCTAGYYVVDSREEFERQLDRIDAEIQTRRETKRELTAAWNQHNTGDSV